MTTYLLAGGGTAGHVNPLLAVADRIRATEADATVLVLGTQEGLESRLVPARGYELIVLPRVPFPRKLNANALRFVPRFLAAVAQVTEVIRSRRVDVVVGFGGYVSTPAYLAARRARVPIVIHEANAKPGMANKLGARLTHHVGVAFAGTPIRHAQFVGMPLRPEIENLNRTSVRPEALSYFSLTPARPVLLVTGGSLGARKLNATIAAAAPALVAAGWQVVHVTGQNSEITDPQLVHYHLVAYCDRMDLALAAADFTVSRAGAATVSELCALGIAAVYVPYPVGNGEQRFNAAPVVKAGGGVMVDDEHFVPAYVEGELVSLLGDHARLAAMARSAASVGVLDGTARMLALVHGALAS